MLSCLYAKLTKNNQVVLDKQGTYTVVWFTVSSGILFLFAFGFSAVGAVQAIFFNILSPLPIISQHLHYLGVKIPYTAWR